MLLPTKVTLNGRRVWLENATDADVEYVEYKSKLGGAHMQLNEKLPDVEGIDNERDD